MEQHRSTIRETVSALKRGLPAIFPTETVYGLGVAVDAAENLQALYDIKLREQKKPISWLIANSEDLDRYGRFIPDFAQVLARTFWPGPLTLVVNASDEVPEAFRSADGTIGLRVPNNQAALRLIELVGCPLATTSANLAGYQPPQTFDDIDENLLERVAAVYVDRDDSDKSGVASTVIDCTKDHPIMMREGAITIADIQALS